MHQIIINDSIRYSAGSRISARAKIKGDSAHASLTGSIDFFPYRSGTVIITELWGLPHDPAPCSPNIFAMHIHERGSCSDSSNMSFSAAGGHYNPNNCPHPAHAGDLPPLFSSRGYAWCGFYTERFSPKDVIGKTVIIHAQRDDFTTQPAGDSGSRIACGVIMQLH